MATETIDKLVKSIINTINSMIKDIKEMEMFSYYANVYLLCLYLTHNNLYLPYRGMKAPEDMWNKIRNNELTEIDKIIQCKNKHIITPTYEEKHYLLSVLSKVDFLSDYFNVPIGSITNLSCVDKNISVNYESGKKMFMEINETARQEMDLKYISINIPVENIGLIRAAEEFGYKYTEGFVNMIGYTKSFFDVENEYYHIQFTDAVESDLYDIEKAYQGSMFPSRFVTEKGFDSKHAMALYANRFRQVYEQKLGRIIIAKIKGQFAGAIIMAIDKNLHENTGLKLNLRSGMGLIVNPETRNMMVGTALVSYRQKLYSEIGIKAVSLGANISNQPMITCMENIGFTYGCQELTMSQWLQD